MTWKAKIYCALGLVIVLTGCSSVYLAKTAGQQIMLLSRREPISRVVQDEHAPPDVRHKLQFVAAARDFAPEIGLNTGEAYTTYSRFDGQALAWVLVGARRDHFQLKTWWFPIVGSIPYKGYVSKGDAEDAAQDLEAQGFETWVRPTVAYSTLGWFNDPVVTPMLSGSEVGLVNTILHELTHRTVWIPGSVAFNETLANFVGMQGAIDYFRRELSLCLQKSSSHTQCEQEKIRFLQATSDEQFEYAFADALSGLYRALNELYSSGKTSEEKIALRDGIFSQHVEAFKKSYPTLRPLKALNNAEVIQLYLYRTQLAQFRLLFKASNSQWPKFWATVRNIAERSEAEDPYRILAETLAPTPILAAR